MSGLGLVATLFMGVGSILGLLGLAESLKRLRRQELARAILEVLPPTDATARALAEIPTTRARSDQTHARLACVLIALGLVLALVDFVATMP